MVPDVGGRHPRPRRGVALFALLLELVKAQAVRTTLPGKAHMLRVRHVVSLWCGWVPAVRVSEGDLSKPLGTVSICRDGPTLPHHGSFGIRNSVEKQTSKDLAEQTAPADPPTLDRQMKESLSTERERACKSQPDAPRQPELAQELPHNVTTRPAS